MHLSDNNSTNKLHKSNTKGTLSLIISIILGTALGFFLRFNPPTEAVLKVIEFPGVIFINFLKLLVVPLIFSSIVTGLADIGSAKEQKKLMRYIILIIFLGLSITFFLAMLISFIFCPELTNFQSSSHVDTNSLVSSIISILYRLVPQNFFYTLSAQDGLIGVLSVSIIMGIVASYNHKVAAPFLNTMKSFQKLIIKMFPHYLVNIGIFSIVAYKLASETNLSQTISVLGRFLMAETVAYLLIIFIVLPTFHFLLTRQNPFKLMNIMKKTLLFSSATASSTGSIPYTLKALEEAKVDSRIANFFIPFGSAINIWGSGFHKPCVIFFLMYLSNTPLNFELLFLLFILCLIFATGGAGIPSGSIMVIPDMLGVIGVPGNLVSYILPIDWLVDRLRTPANVYGDAVGACILDHHENK
ncbi:MAG: cation:dicarboxylase symporter family transporter [Chlamydiales bacterium]|nr:dicarboxylate/amino acid:cation symporter [Chlamydiales bacterium]NCF70341.1 cation:dicarboxylase symporter family transporter [Chlamydiales bacterium]